MAAQVLGSLAITLEDARAQVARIVGSGDEVTTGQIPFTPRAKKVLDLALREALSLGHNYIGTEHLLLGLVRENEGVATRILLDFDADAEKIRNAVIEMISARAPEAEERAQPAADATSRRDVLALRSSRRARRRFRTMPRRSADYSTRSVLQPLLLGWFLFGAALAVGILIGWLIWG